MTKIRTLSPVPLGLFLAAVIVQACASDGEAPFPRDASVGSGGASSPPVGAGGYTSGNGGAVVAAGGSSPSCNVGFCAAMGTGKACCLSSGTCGVDFGTGCTRLPPDAGTGAGGYRGTGGYRSAGGSSASGGKTSSGGSGGGTSSGGAYATGGSSTDASLGGD